MVGPSGESAVVAGVDMVGGMLVFKWQPLSDGRQLEYLFFNFTPILLLHSPLPLPSMCLNGTQQLAIVTCTLVAPWTASSCSSVYNHNSN